MFLEASVAVSSDAVSEVEFTVPVVRVSVAVSKVSAASPSSVPSPVHTPTWLFTGVHTFVTSHPPAGVPHLIPVTSAESAIGIVPFAHTASREAVLAPVPTARSHLASQIASVATDPPPDITISPLHCIEVELIVLMFVQDIRVSCFALRAVCVAVEIGSSARVQSLGLLESDTSAIKIISQVAGVTQVVSVGKSRSLIVFLN